MNKSFAPRAARILIVDDHGIVRDGIGRLLERVAGLSVAGSVATGAEAVEAAQRLLPDLVIMDLVMPDLNGIDAMQRILKLLPKTLVIILSASGTSEHLFRALRAGARGYVVKDAPGMELVAAVQAVLLGKRYISPRLSALVDEDRLANPDGRSPLERLSPREREVLHQTVAGYSSAEIAGQLSLSPKTIDTYRSRLMIKLGVTDRSMLIRYGIEHAMTPL